MAYTSTKMGLSVWDQPNDRYDHNQLADNWNKVDFHDHTLGRGVQIPTEGIADGAITNVKLDPSVVITIPDNSVTSAKIAAGAVQTADISDLNITTSKLADGAVTTVKIADNNVTTQKIAAGNITLAKLATDALNNFLKLGVSADRKVRFGTGTWTWAGQSEVNQAVAHGLGVVPIFAIAAATNHGTIYFNNGVNAGVLPGGYSAEDATNVTFKCVCGFVPSVGATTTFSWLAIG